MRWVITSFDDCPMFTWSLGCTGEREPITPPIISMARFEMTSFTFMFVDVPLPGLENVHHELVVQIAVYHLIGRLHNAVLDVVVQQVQLGIDLRCRPA